MEIRRLGETGPDVSVIGLGCNNFGMKLDERQARKVVDAAVAAGITHFDTAESYGGGFSETYLGKALGARRDRVVIATKFAPRPQDEPYSPGVLRARILDGCETSLRRLGTDCIDVYYQHRPDPQAPVEEALEALSGLVDAGRVRYAACSNYDARQIDEAARVWTAQGLARFVGCQIHWNLLVRRVEAEIVPAALRQGMGVVPYFPLESGLLTGKYRAGEEYPPGSRLATMSRFAALATPETFAYVEKLVRFAAERDRSLLELAFAWLASQEGVSSIIAGATTPEQVAANVVAGGSWRLTAEESAGLPRPR